MYQTEINMGKIIAYFTILAIVIACLGLFGLTSYIIEQRTKEIGIRKTMGASIPSIMRVLSNEFILLIVISNLLAYLPAYYLLNNWLDGFAYRTELSLWTFIGTSCISILIALVTISSQALKAAITNPVESLKYE